MNRVEAIRMLKLADYLENVPRKEFNMNTWGERDACGTVACAMGHAASMPTFKRLGVKSKWITYNDTYDGSLAALQITSPNGRQGGFSTACEVFGITILESRELFSANHDKRETPKQVAKDLRKFVKSKGF